MQGFDDLLLMSEFYLDQYIRLFLRWGGRGQSITLLQ